MSDIIFLYFISLIVWNCLLFWRALYKSTYKVWLLRYPGYECRHLVLAMSLGAAILRSCPCTRLTDSQVGLNCHWGFHQLMVHLNPNTHTHCLIHTSVSNISPVGLVRRLVRVSSTAQRPDEDFNMGQHSFLNMLQQWNVTTAHVVLSDDVHNKQKAFSLLEECLGWMTRCSSP